jgi:hypothetical protein
LIQAWSRHFVARTFIASPAVIFSIPATTENGLAQKVALAVPTQQSENKSATN